MPSAVWEIDGQKFSPFKVRSFSGMLRKPAGIVHVRPWRSSWNNVATNNPSLVKRYMQPMLLLIAHNGPASPSRGVTKPPSSRVVPINSPGRSGGGDSCEACSPGQRLGYDQVALPWNMPGDVPPSDCGANGLEATVRMIWPSAATKAWSPPEESGACTTAASVSPFSKS